jgi:hypothetical protein
MYKYYIPELNLRDVRNNPNLLQNLENNFNKQTTKDNIIIASNGYYKYEGDNLIKYKIIQKETLVKENFLKQYNLIGMSEYHKKIGEAFSIPYENDQLIVEKIKFSVGKGTNFLVLEKRNDKIIDVYFMSNKKIEETCRFFADDISLFLEMLMCK